MKIRRFVPSQILLAAFLCTPTVGQSQNIWDRVHIRHNLDAANQVPKPAFLQFTWPDSGRSVRSVGLGLRVDLVQRPLIEMGPYLDLQQNTATDKEQDVRKLGLNAEWQLRDLLQAGAGGTGVLIISAGYKRDRIAKERAAQFTLNYTRVYPNGLRFPRPNTTIRLGPAIDIVYGPYLGLDIEKIYSAKNAAAEGDVGRLSIVLDINVYPAGRALDQRLEILASGAYKRDIWDTTSQSDDDHALGKLEVTYYVFRSADRNAGIGLAYVNGEDPSKGFAKQAFTQLSFKLQLK